MITVPIIYPDREDFQWWIEHLKSGDPLLKMKLPDVDEEWYQDMCSTVDRLQLPCYEHELHIIAARLFYKVCKHHYRIDGNKRSAIVVIYLFYLMNGYLLSQRIGIKDFTVKVARSRPKKETWWLSRIEKDFSKNVIKLS